MSESDCSHYQRKCKLVAPCCGRMVNCRLCHDDSENHNLVRTQVEQLVCKQCNLKQKVAKNCSDCGVLFGNYSCLVCRLFDDRDKEQFHCELCGICRVGGRENFFHCTVCNMCLSITIKDSHKCLKDLSKSNCPVCLEDIHTSRKSVHVPNCSHLIHEKCFTDMASHGKFNCPICCHSIFDMSTYWKNLDQAVEQTPMPELYRNYNVNILCCDCHSESRVLFHVVGLKCKQCGGYNTTRTGGGDDPIPSDPYDTLREMVGELNEIGRAEAEGASESDGSGEWLTVSEGEDDDNEQEDNTDQQDAQQGQRLEQQQELSNEALAGQNNAEEEVE